jgi:mannan endo-1,4-beta-mannosidase
MTRHALMGAQAVLASVVAVPTYDETVLATAGLVSYWETNEAAGATVAADSKGTNHATAYGGVTFGVDGPFAGAKAVTFNGSSGYLNAGNAASLNLGDTFAYELWLNFSSTGGDTQGLIGKGWNSGSLRIWWDQRLALLRNGAAASALSADVIPTGWHHVAVTKAGASNHLYLDGVDATGTVTNQTCATNTYPFMIGCDAAGGTAEGFSSQTVSKVAVYNVALDPVTVAAHFTLGADVPPVDTTSPFLQRSGTTLTFHGVPYTLIGANVYPAFWPAESNPIDLATDAPILAQYVNAARVFAFQSTAITGGVRDWSRWDAALALFAANGIKVVVCLTDTWGQDHQPVSDSVYDRAITWFAGGYATDVEGVATYRAWVIEAVTRYKDNETIAMWQLINEGHDTAGYDTEAASRATLKAWVDDMAALVKSIDSNHLVASGISGGGGGTNARDFGLCQTSPNVDVMEYHDWGHATDMQPYPAEPLGFDDGNNGWADHGDAVTNGKIFMILEYGIVWLRADGAHGGPLTRAQRATILDAKVAAQLAAGSQGEFFYHWGSGVVSADPARDVEFVADDPLLPLLAAHLP